jgi:hypothetical protein
VLREGNVHSARDWRAVLELELKLLGFTCEKSEVGALYSEAEIPLLATPKIRVWH